VARWNGDRAADRDEGRRLKYGYTRSTLSTIFHPALHPLFEAAGYAAGFGVYKWQRERSGDALSDERRWVVIAAAAVGALLGARVLGLLEQAPRVGLHWADLLKPGGKTIVGGLLGGWIAVEVAKRIAGVKSRTGDLFAVPLCVGIAVGRLGCFFAGLADDTYGKATRLPWGVDFGDGIKRHPTQLYEFCFLAILAWVLWRWNERPHGEGQVFRGFMAAYLGWRLVEDFLKPQPVIAGMNWIQWACVAGLVGLAVGEWRRRVRNV
jgi:phosphatidylglycerol:prolipoprotein diacylglycerol transferase